MSCPIAPREAILCVSRGHFSVEISAFIGSFFTFSTDDCSSFNHSTEVYLTATVTLPSPLGT